MKKSIWAAAAAIVIIGASLGGWLYFQQSYTFEQTQTVIVTPNAIPPHASYSANGKIVAETAEILFDQSVAAGKMLNQEALDGIKMKPELAGKWFFKYANVLAFQPDKNWIPGESYTVKLPNEIFAEGAKLKTYTLDFDAPKFTAQMKEAAFYEDPRNISHKAVTATFDFSYPVRESEIKNGISLKTAGGKTYDFTYTLENNNMRVNIVSEPVQIGADEDIAIIRAEKTANAYNNVKLQNMAEARVVIPSVRNFFKLSGATSFIVYNEENDNNPEQVLELQFSTAVDDSSLKQKTKFYFCTKDCTAKSAAHVPNRNWLSVTTEMLPAIPGSNSRLFRYNITQRDAKLLVRIDSGLTSKEGYRLTNNIDTILYAANYPQEAHISFDGAIIPLKNEQKLSFVSRGVNKLNIKAARIEEDDLNHLVTQTRGDFATPYFINYEFDERNIAMIFEKNLYINSENPSKLDYSSLDITPYLKGKNGIFLVTVKGMQGDDAVTSADKRLIIVTDLGIIAKNDADGSHGLYAANISEGKPATGAKIEVLGRNGLPVLSAVTDKRGFALLPSFDDFANERQPVAYKISNNGDISFLPIDRQDRILDYSRYNVGGEQASRNKDELKGYLFSDRGIYRPGETADFGMMVRREDLSIPQGVPLIAKIHTPDWKQVSQKRFSASDTGLAEMAYDIPATAPLGRYSLTLYKKGSDYDRYISSLDFDVEEFKPDTMKLKLAFVPTAPQGWSTADKAEIKAILTNLYGTAAAGHTVKGHYRLVPAQFKFAQYAGYNFADPYAAAQQNFTAVAENFNDTETDTAGMAELAVDLNKYTRGTYRLTAAITGLEREGGRGVENTISELVSPSPYIIGYQTDTADNNLHFLAKGSAHQIRFIAVDSDLKQIAAKDLTLEISSKKEIRTLARLPNGTFGYQRQEKETVLTSDSFEIAEEGAAYQPDTATPGDFALTIREKGGKELLRLGYSIEGAANENFKSDKQQNLALSLDKKAYANGDTIRVQIRAPFAGFGLMTIEQDKVYAFKWFKMKDKAGVQEIVLPEGVDGNAYLNVALVRDIRSPEIFDKPLSYAIAPFNISKATFDLPIELNVPLSAKPGEELKIGYKATEDADIFLWGVNTGILQAADYKLPSPLNFFIGRKALQVTTRQIMDLILPDIGLSLQLAAPGGGMDTEESEAMLKLLNPFARKQDKPAAFWSGMLKAGPEEQFFSYRVPETFNGEMKIMAAGMNTKRFGSAEKPVLVRGDFAITPATALNTAPGDVFDAGAAVSNLVERSGKGYATKFSIAVTGGLEIIGPQETLLSIDENGEASAAFKVKALPNPGPQMITFTAEAAENPTKRAVMTQEISIRPAMPFATDVTAGYARRNVTLKNFAKKLFPEMRSQKAYASTSPLILAKGLLQYLGKYPHFCTEQSISKIFPAMTLFFEMPAQNANAYVTSSFVYDTFDDVLGRLAARQRINGGFAAWDVPSLQADKFVSIYALEFLTAAKKYGFEVPEGMYSRALDYAKTIAAEEPAAANDTIAAYAAYVLSEAGVNASNYLINLEDLFTKKFKNDWRSTLNGAYIAAGYKLLNNPKKAEAARGNYRFGKNDTDDARFIYVMNKTFGAKGTEVRQKQIETLLKPLKNQNFNTVSAAFSVLALAETGNENADMAIKFSGAEARHDGNYVYAAFAPETEKLSISANKPFFYTIEQEGFATEMPQSAFSSGLQVSKEFKAPKGKTMDNLAPGDEVTVQLTVQSIGAGSVSDVAVVDLLPGCLEIVRGSFDSDSYLLNSEAREDRALVYLNASRNPTTISYRAKVVAKGDFTVPPVFANAMYDSTVKAYSKPARLIIGD